MKKSDDRKNIFKAAVAFIFWLAVWEVLCLILKDNVFLPDPFKTLKSLADLVITKTFYIDVLATLIRCISGILLSFITGVLLAALSYRSDTVRALLNLPVRFLKATPVMAVIIYAIIIMTSDSVPVFVCFLMCFPVVYINVLSGLNNMNTEYLEMAAVFKMSEYAKIRWLYIPSVMPEIRSSLDLISGLSWKSVVAAEVLSVPDHSMGYNLMNAKYYLETPSLFAWVAAIVFVSWSFEKLIKHFLGKTDFREYSKSRIKWVNGSSAVRQESRPVTVRNLTKRYNGQKVIDRYSETFEADKVTAVMAPSGYGKTTLMRMIAGLEAPDSGEIERSDNISCLFQEDRTLPWLNIYDNLAVVLRDKIEENEGKRRIEKILKIMQLWDHKEKLPGQLSGGMRHRLSMARAFIFPSDLLLIDEPFKGLDKELKQKIITGAWKNTTKGKTVLMITHYIEDTDQLADRTVHLNIKAGK